MIKKIVQDPDPILHKKADPIKNINDPSLKELIQDMRDTLIEQDGAGLAAPQIGVSKQIFVIPQEYAPKVRSFLSPLSFLKPLQPWVYINPKLIEQSSAKVTTEEGCLSVAGTFHHTPRANEVTLEATDERGRRFRVRADGLLARIYQHETDHLNGTLFLERTLH